MMAPIPQLAANATKAQALAYLARYFGHAVYHNSAKTPYEGMRYARLYAYIEQHNPGASPHDIAAAAADLLLSSAFTSTVGQAVTASGNKLGAVATGVATASYLPSWLTGFPWLRIGEVLLGLVLLAVGVAKMTDAVPIATKVAKAVS